MKKVALIYGEDRQENIKKALMQIREDLKPIQKARTILIKPNLVGLLKTDGNTQKETIEALLEFLKDFCRDFKDKKIYLFEGSGDAYYLNSNTKSIFQKLGYFKLLKRYPNLILKPIEEEKSYFEEEIETFKGLKKIRIAQIIKKVDYSISLSLPKTHNYVIFTGGLKNFLMAGIHQEDKHLMHGHDYSALYQNPLKRKIPSFLIYLLAKLRRRITEDSKDFQNHYLKKCEILHRNLAKLGQKISPDLVILDAWKVMEGEGPVEGKLVPFRLAIASIDGLKADGLAVRLMGKKPEEIDYLHYLEKGGKGTLSLDGLIGEKNWSCYSKKIKMHPLYLIQKRWK